MITSHNQPIVEGQKVASLPLIPTNQSQQDKEIAELKEKLAALDQPEEEEQ
jgi:hypothetical protein